MLKHRKRKYGTISGHRSFKMFLLCNLLVTVIVILIVIIFSFINSSPFFLMPEIKIQGSHYENQNLLRNLIVSDLIFQKPWRAWFGQNHLIFWLGRLDPNISKYLPSVRKAEVQVSFRAKQVTVTITERRPWGVICEKNGSCFSLDEDGVIFAPAPEVEGFLIVKIIDPNNRVPRLGQAVLKDRAWIDNVVKTTAEIRRHGFYPKEIEIKDISLKEWAIKTSRGTTLLFSLRFKPESLINVLEKFSDANTLSRISLIDFRIPDKVYYKQF